MAIPKSTNELIQVMQECYDRLKAAEKVIDEALDIHESDLTPELPDRFGAALVGKGLRPADAEARAEQLRRQILELRNNLLAAESHIELGVKNTAEATGVASQASAKAAEFTRDNSFTV